MIIRYFSRETKSSRALKIFSAGNGEYIFHNYDHTFPLRYKAQKGMKPGVSNAAIKKSVKLYLRKQAHYRAHGGE